MEKLTFEQSLERLEAIVKLLETGKAPLDESMKLYEEGIALVRSCTEELERAQAKIGVLQNDGNGETVVVPFTVENS